MKKQPIRHAQYPLYGAEELAVDDTMVDVEGVEREIGSAGEHNYEFVFLPVDAIVVGGGITVEEPSNDTGAATISVGDEGDAVRYAEGVDLKVAGFTALDVTGFVNRSGKPVLIQVDNANGDADTGKLRIALEYIRLGRAQENQTH